MRTKSYEYNEEHPNNETIVRDLKRMTNDAIRVDEEALNNLQSDYKQHHTARQQKGGAMRNNRPQKGRQHPHNRNFAKNNNSHRNFSK